MGFSTVFEPQAILSVKRLAVGGRGDLRPLPARLGRGRNAQGGKTNEEQEAKTPDTTGWKRWHGPWG
jgi:hypothetical protein